METQQLQTGVRVPFCFETFRPHHHPELSGAGWGEFFCSIKGGGITLETGFSEAKPPAAALFYDC